MKIILPTMDRVVVLPIEEKEEISGLSIVRDHKNTEMQIGEIIAHGPESIFRENVSIVETVKLWWKGGLRPVRDGIRVLYNPSAGTLLRRLKEDGRWEDLRIMHSDTVQCVIDD